jgi:hypothetical protein
LVLIKHSSGVQKGSPGKVEPKSFWPKISKSELILTVKGI